MLNGIYTYNVDGKGRIVMPGRFLDALGNPFVLTGNPDGCLVAASQPELLRERAGVRGFVECRIKDPTGRFVIPSALREYADLHQTGEAAVIGAGDEVEIWNKRRWESQARSPFPMPGRGGPTSDPLSYAPPPSSGVTVRQKALYGQPYLEIEGALTLSETDRVLTRLETALRGRPRTLFLDLRGVDTVDAAFLVALEPLVRQLAAHGGRMAVLTERADVATLVERLCGLKYARVFTNLESGLWWLVDEGHA
ncbi:MAG: STAS domain-containing protein [Armatimonadetes bacterium]|nr:STAS domain-containing protein [Armatimonadota bacterium]